MPVYIDLRWLKERGKARGSGHTRTAHDWYRESASAVDALLDAETFSGQKFYGVLCDPACGGGNIPDRCVARGLSCVGSDVVHRGWERTSVVNFFDVATRFDSIITNPPFGMAEEFVRHALTLTSDRVAILSRLAFLEGQRRRVLFQSTPLARVWVFSSRQSMPPGGSNIEAKGGAVAYAWLVWQHGHGGKPTLGWLP